MSYLVIVNSKSGTARDRGSSNLRADLESAFAERNVAADIHLVHPRDLEGTIRQAVAGHDGKRRIVVGGGDGSLSTAASLLSGTQIPLGVLSLGTMNLLARAIGMPLDPVEAINALIDAQPAKIDLLNVGGRKVLMHASIGLQPKIIRIREALPYRTRFIRLLNGLIAWARATRKIQRMRISGKMGERQFERNASAVLISNNVLPEGVAEAPVAHNLGGGKVAIYVTESKKRSDLVRLALSTSMGVWRQSDLIEEFTTTEFEIDADRQSLLVSLDGELVTFDTPISVNIMPGALSILVPLHG